MEKAQRKAQSEKICQLSNMEVKAKRFVGMFAASGMGNSVFIENLVDQYKHINILKENFNTSAQKLGIQNTFILYQDNDPKLTTLNIRL